MTTSEKDKNTYFITEAIKEAEKAFTLNEIPIGAIIESNDKIIARAHNQVEMLQDVTAHAEILAITAASQYLGAKYLKGCNLYITIEPCCMCASAAFWAQINTIVWGADDEKHGYTTINKNIIHPKTTIVKGILPDECLEPLQRFFKNKRTHNGDDESLEK